MEPSLSCPVEELEAQRDKLLLATVTFHLVTEFGPEYSFSDLSSKAISSTPLGEI